MMALPLIGLSAEDYEAKRRDDLIRQREQKEAAIERGRAIKAHNKYISARSVPYQGPTTTKPKKVSNR